MSRRALIGLAALVLVAGCGKKVVLKPAPGHPLPPKAATSPQQPGVTQLLSMPPQEHPGRDDELLIKSQPLAPDRFDLPPPG